MLHAATNMCPPFLPKKWRFLRDFTAKTETGTFCTWTKAVFVRLQNKTSERFGFPENGDPQIICDAVCKVLVWRATEVRNIGDSPGRPWDVKLNDKKRCSAADKHQPCASFLSRCIYSVSPEMPCEEKKKLCLEKSSFQNRELDLEYIAHWTSLVDTASDNYKLANQKRCKTNK